MCVCMYVCVTGLRSFSRVNLFLFVEYEVKSQACSGQNWCKSHSRNDYHINNLSANFTCKPTASLHFICRWSPDPKSDWTERRFCHYEG